MRVLMCPPAYYQVKWEINPWMDKNVQPDLQKAWQQWHRIFEIYQRLRFKIYLMQPMPELPDMIFTANGGIIIKNTCVLANFRHPERRPEQAYFKEWIERLGLKTTPPLSSDVYFEGQGDWITTREAYLFGWGIRSSFEAYKLVKSQLKLQKPILPLRLVDPHFYHLDTCLMSIYPINAVMYYPEAFDAESRDRILRLDAEKIEVTKEEAQNLVCNGIYYEDTVVLGGASARIIRLLRRRGLEVINLDVSEFKKSGAGVRCLTLFLD